MFSVCSYILFKPKMKKLVDHKSKINVVLGTFAGVLLEPTLTSVVISKIRRLIKQLYGTHPKTTTAELKKPTGDDFRVTEWTDRGYLTIYLFYINKLKFLTCLHLALTTVSRLFINILYFC